MTATSRAMKMLRLGDSPKAPAKQPKKQPKASKKAAKKKSKY